MEEMKTTKPLSLVREDFMRNLTDLLNNSGLPLLMIEPIMEDALRNITYINKQRLEEDRKQWEALSKQNGDDELGEQVNLTAK